MIQSVIITILITGAGFYLIRLIYTSFTSRSCEAGCGGCSTLDVDAMVRSMEEKSKAKPTL